jgi:hypothetical protein
MLDDAHIAKRICRLPIPYRSILLQVLDKAETISHEELLKRHAENASNLLYFGLSDGYVPLPSCREKRYIKDTVSDKEYTLKEFSNEFNVSFNTVRTWAYRRKLGAKFSNFIVVKK